MLQSGVTWGNQSRKGSAQIHNLNALLHKEMELYFNLSFISDI